MSPARFREDEADTTQETVDRIMRRAEGGAALVLAGLCGLTALALLVFDRPVGAAAMTIVAIGFSMLALALLGAGEEEDD